MDGILRRVTPLTRAGTPLAYRVQVFGAGGGWAEVVTQGTPAQQCGRRRAGGDTRSSLGSFAVRPSYSTLRF
jgi:hypothetical protein